MNDQTRWITRPILILFLSIFLFSSSSSFGQWDQSNPTSSSDISRTGKISVGDDGTGVKLDVNGQVEIRRQANPLSNLPGGWADYLVRIGISANNFGEKGLRFLISKDAGSSFSDVLHLDGNANVGIGTTVTGDHRLAVKGKIGCEELIVKPVGHFPDYVFLPDYPLMSLTAMDRFIQEEGRLPKMPIGKEIDESRKLPVGELSLLQQEKIEEIYLHLIDLNEQVKMLEAKHAVLQAKLDAIDTHKKFQE